MSANLVEVDATSFLKDLSRKRRGLVESLRINGVEEGILTFLSDLYPDRAHFIYELLQNAEDAQATTVEFEVRRDRLRFAHNGIRLFTSADVDSITSIGTSTKKTSINQIGKFGVGFKAVFSYTRTPQIFSGDYTFQIEDLVCPIELPAIKRASADTIFIFPFDNPRKPPDSCFEEICSVLQTLDHTALLFLNHIREVKWTVQAQGSGFLRRAEMTGNLVEITRSAEPPLYFLRYQKALERHGDLRCGIAFSLDARSEKQRPLLSKLVLHDQFRLDSANGKLCIFFPAEKETTGLKFHINAPFASTIDRASIPHDHKENKAILSDISDLFIQAIHDLRNENLLTAETLEVLPNNQDELPPFYQPLRARLIEAMKSESLVPTRSGGHAPATVLIRGPKRISDVLTGDHLDLFAPGKSDWAANVMQNGRADKFLAALAIPDWGFSELISAMDTKLSWYVSDESWISERDDDWLRRFYLLLHTATKSADEEAKLKCWQVLRTTDGHRAGFRSDVYLPADGHAAAQSFTTISQDIMANLQTEARQRLVDFFKAAGVQELGEREELQVILDSYYSDEKDSGLKEKQHLAHIKRFIRWFEQHKDLSPFEDKCIFWDSRKSGKHQARHCYLDKPFLGSNLSILYEMARGGTGSRTALWKGYANTKNFTRFAEALGVAARLEVAAVGTHNHPLHSELRQHSDARWTSTKIDRDFTIPDLKRTLDRRDRFVSRLVWQTLCKVDASELTARFRPNQQYPLQSRPSSLVLILRENAWIPGKDGNFYTPAEMTKANLPKDFEYDDGNGWLTNINFGEKERKATEGYQRKARLGDELGLNLDDISLLQKLKQNPTFYNKVRSELEAATDGVAFPERPIRNPERRKEKIKEKIQDAPQKEYEMRSRSVRLSKPELDAQTWLRQEYQNENEDVICQICECVMPFKKRNGEYYFEAVSVSSAITKELEASFIGLCPLCAAKYMEFIRRDEKADRALLKAIARSAEPKIQLNLGEEAASLRFVGAHWHDLKLIIEELSLT